MKHAYLIMAHANVGQLSQLLLALDDPRNDIYLHIDAKSDIDLTQLAPPNLQMRYSSIEYCRRVDVRWGHVSQVEAELALFEKASHTPHSYYHLLSGIDLPLHGQDFIHQYFEGKNQEYIGFAKNWDVRGRVFCHNILMAHMRQPNRYAQFLLVKLRIWFNKLQMSLGYRVPQPNLTYKAGSNWVSVTHDFVVSLLEKKCELLTMYRYACCPDEIYKHTFAFNSGFKDRIAKEGSLREIDWNRGTPYIWRNEDYDYLSKSKCLFARKFDGKVDSEIINRILAKINE